MRPAGKPPQRYAPEGGMEAYTTGAGNPVTVLTREQDRKLRAQAWAHVRRINARIARQIHAKVRARQK